MLILFYILTLYHGPFPISYALAYCMVSEASCEAFLGWGFIGWSLYRLRKA